MKKYILGAILSIGILVSPAFTQAAGLTTDQATILINVVKSSPSTPAGAFVDLITAFSGVTVNQATALITVVQSSPTTSASVFVPLLTSFTSDTSTTQTTMQPTTQTTTQSTAVKSPTCTLNVAYGPGGVAKKYGLTGTGYYDGSGSTYVEIHDGEPVTISWASTNADYSQGPGGDKDLANGSATYYPGGNKAYVWNFYGNGGYTSCGVMVEVFPNPDIPACALTASKNTAVPGDHVTLSWTSEDAAYASWVQDSTADVLGLPLDKLSDFGSQVVTVAGKGYLTPTLSIFGKGGSSLCSATIMVTAPAVVCNKGDVNSDGVISQSDQEQVMRFVVGLVTLTDAEKNRADTNGDGLVQLNDAIDIGGYVARQITIFQACPSGTVGLPVSSATGT
ncbi:MAG: dockerin type I repeat-containing protein [Candidatus Parcubacteria bacterium]|nr:dockerin type I repeat-containing protein [Candidatus Parcubacteria bacterium]